MKQVHTVACIVYRYALAHVALPSWYCLISATYGGNIVYAQQIASIEGRDGTDDI